MGGPPLPGYVPASTDGELLPVVDWDDRDIGVAPRAEIHAKGLLHRAVHVVVINAAGEILLQKRSHKKDHYGGWWDVSVGGHVNPGELYVEAAVRELDEEMGIRDAAVELAAIAPPTSLTGWEHIHVFSCRHAGPIAPNPDEIDDARWVDPHEYIANAREDAEEEHWRVTPCSRHTVGLWWEAGGPGRKGR